MENDKPIELMTTAELREAMQIYYRQSQTPAAALPQAPALKGSETPAVQDNVNGLFASHVMAKPTGSWTPAEKEFIRSHTAAALKDLGY